MSRRSARTPALTLGRLEWRPGASERWLRSMTGALMWAGIGLVLLVQSFVPSVQPDDSGFWRTVFTIPIVVMVLLNFFGLSRVSRRRLQISTELLNMIPALVMNIALLQITHATALVLLNVIIPLIYAGYFFRLPALALSIFASIGVAISTLFTEPASQAPGLVAFLCIYLPTIVILPLLLHMHNNETLDALDAARDRALTDPVTGLANLRALDDAAARELARSDRGVDGVLGLLLLDLDNFKSANIKYGHAGGDHALRQIATQLQRVAPKRATIARIGGDEFAVLVRRASHRQIIETGQILRAAVRAANAVMDMPGVDIDAAVGVATYPEDGDDLTHLLDGADRSMHAAKGEKRHTLPNLEAVPSDSDETPPWLDTAAEKPPTRRGLTLDAVIGGGRPWLGTVSLYGRMSALTWAVGSLALTASLLAPDHPESPLKWWMVLAVGIVMTAGSLLTSIEPRSAAHIFFDFCALLLIGAVIAMTGGFASPAALLLVLLVASQSWFWHTEQVGLRVIGPPLIALSPIAYQSAYDAPQGMTSLVTFYGLAALLVTLALTMYYDRVLLSKLEQRAEELAMVDPLTGMPNRRAFDEHLERMLDPTMLTDRFAIVMIDLDGFRDVNAKSGRQAGDTVLCAIAATLEAATRRNDLIARIGGDEFAAVLSGVGVDAARSLAERFVDRIAATPEAVDAGVGASAGFALYPVHGRTPDQLVFTADSALMTVKAGGKGGARVARIVSAVS